MAPVEAEFCKLKTTSSTDVLRLSKFRGVSFVARSPGDAVKACGSGNSSNLLHVAVAIHHREPLPLAVRPHSFNFDWVIFQSLACIRPQPETRWQAVCVF